MKIENPNLKLRVNLIERERQRKEDASFVTLR
jgi:hypothetical protein